MLAAPRDGRRDASGRRLHAGAFVAAVDVGDDRAVRARARASRGATRLTPARPRVSPGGCSRAPAARSAPRAPLRRGPGRARSTSHADRQRSGARAPRASVLYALMHRAPAPPPGDGFADVCARAWRRRVGGRAAASSRAASPRPLLVLRRRDRSRPLRELPSVAARAGPGQSGPRRRQRLSRARRRQCHPLRAARRCDDGRRACAGARHDPRPALAAHAPILRPLRRPLPAPALSPRVALGRRRAVEIPRDLPLLFVDEPRVVVGRARRLLPRSARRAASRATRPWTRRSCAAIES